MYKNTDNSCNNQSLHLPDFVSSLTLCLHGVLLILIYFVFLLKKLIVKWSIGEVNIFWKSWHLNELLLKVRTIRSCLRTSVQTVTNDYFSQTFAKLMFLGLLSNFCPLHQGKEVFFV